MNRPRKMWMIIGIAMVLALAFSASVAAVTAVPLDPPAPSSSKPQPDEPTGASVSLPATAATAPTKEPDSTGKAAVTVRVRVEAARLLVLDENGVIAEIWSNTGPGDVVPTISARMHSVDGAVLETVPPQALLDYELLRDTIDWSACGLVYVAAQD